MIWLTWLDVSRGDRHGPACPDRPASAPARKHDLGELLPLPDAGRGLPADIFLELGRQAVHQVPGLGAVVRMHDEAAVVGQTSEHRHGIPSHLCDGEIMAVGCGKDVPGPFRVDGTKNRSLFPEASVLKH